MDDLSDDEWVLTYHSPRGDRVVPEPPSGGSAVSGMSGMSMVFCDFRQSHDEPPAASSSDPAEEAVGGTGPKFGASAAGSATGATGVGQGESSGPGASAPPTCGECDPPGSSAGRKKGRGRPRKAQGASDLPWGWTTANYLWDSACLFPDGINDRLSLANITAATKFDCRSPLCPAGGCLEAAGSMRLLLGRQSFEAAVGEEAGKDARRLLLSRYMQASFSLELNQFRPIEVWYSNGPMGRNKSSMRLCEKGVGLGVASVSADLFGKVRADVRQGKVYEELRKIKIHEGEPDDDARDGVARSWLAAYYSSGAEHDPVPGAKRTVQFSGMKESQEVIYRRYAEEMGDQAFAISKFKSILKAFKAEHVRDFGESEHPKCTECARLKSLCRMFKLQPAKLAEYVKELAEHKECVGVEREEMDDQAARSIHCPWEVLMMQVDAATQSNFLLPRVKGRRTKATATLPRFKQKIFGSVSFGEGSRIFIVPPSIAAGADLTITIIHLSVLRALAERGAVLPQELHLQLDNTTGDNKNEAMILYAAWLVETGQVQPLRPTLTLR